ncbi:Bug family tripartite tricarboxylate transporter substrate binding protein [Brevibacterium yomogidense]|uniref:Bug family tripartite tricarboxylate transporter substrate binding protein n=1 Tax=Brevibacterium yomogidense TaxID=946573 RepID=UPI0018DF234B|nr:tripartite tricarboxylate transporter substrate binding protein [Brevibacterium yomogidense]
MFRNTRARRPLMLISTAAAVGLALSACGNVTGGGGGGDFPSQNITLTVGQAAGGSTDLIARAVADGSQDAFGVSMTVENQPGANGAIATKDVAGRAANGYDLVLLNASLITITSLTASEEETVDLDDLDIVMGLSQDDYIMVANADSDIDTVDDMVESDESVSYGTTGVGTASQLAQLLLMEEADVDGNEVPFDSGAPALTAVMGGQVEVATLQLGEAMPQIDAGAIKPIVVFSEERLDYLPDVPTAVEEGYDVPVSQYRALAMPAGADDEVLSSLRDGVEEITQTDSYKQFNEDNFLTPAEISGDEVREQWTDLAERYAALVEENDIDLGGAQN